MSDVETYSAEEPDEPKNNTLNICTVRLEFSSINPNQVVFKLGTFFHALSEKLELKNRHFIADSTTIEYASKGILNAISILIAVDNMMNLDNLELMLRRNINNVEVSIKKTGQTMTV